jgi:hypothetical protein
VLDTYALRCLTVTSLLSLTVCIPTFISEANQGKADFWGHYVVFVLWVGSNVILGSHSRRASEKFAGILEWGKDFPCFADLSEKAPRLLIAVLSMSTGIVAGIGAYIIDHKAKIAGSNSEAGCQDDNWLVELWCSGGHWHGHFLPMETAIVVGIAAAVIALIPIMIDCPAAVIDAFKTQGLRQVAGKGNREDARTRRRRMGCMVFCCCCCCFSRCKRHRQPHHTSKEPEEKAVTENPVRFREECKETRL